jgi:riboflavin synthase
MFTGIIEELGEVLEAGSHLKIRCRTVLEDASLGSSIAVNGVCLTVVELDRDGFSADLAPETLARTNLGALTRGSLVNLERPLAAGQRLSGHIVQGHIDGTAEFLSLDPLPEENWSLAIRVPPELDRYLIYKGSVALDGVSLTIASLENCILGAAIIPHTYENTAMRAYRRGARVNIEVDLIAKYVEKLVAARS